MNDADHSSRGDDVALLERAVASDESARTEIVMRLTPVFAALAIYATRRWRGGRIGSLDADDLVGELFGALFADDANALTRWDVSRSSLETFGKIWGRSRIHEIMRKEMRRADILERRGLDQDGGEPVTRDRPDEIIAAQRLGRAILACVEAAMTTALARRMIDLILIRQLDTDELVRRTDMKRQGIFRWRSRVLEQARKCWERLSRDAS